MRFVLPGPDIVTLSCQTVDKLIHAGSGDAALLYLFILKTQGQASPQDAAAALGKSVGGIADAIAVLSRIGLIVCDNETRPAPSHGLFASASHAADASESGEETHEPRRYSPEEIKSEMEANATLRALVYEAQNSLGKILSSEELERLLGIYDGLQMPAEVILLLITHCISESRGRGSGRMPSISYIEKAAYTWAREGVITLDRADEYLMKLEILKSARGRIKAALRITDMELSDSEKRYVDNWISMGFDDSAVEIAFDRTLLQTGKLAWSYMDSIMGSWHSKGIHTPKEIMQKDSKDPKVFSGRAASSSRYLSN